MWIKNQQVPNGLVPSPYPGREGAFISYNIPDTDSLYDTFYSRSWIYDDATGTIALSMQGDFESAERVLSVLTHLLETENPPDGRIGFSFNTDNSYIERLYRCGSLAWVGYAMLFYEEKSNDTQFEYSAEQIASFLLSQQDKDPESPSYGLLKGGPDVTWISTEFNIDAYFFFKKLGQITGNSTYTEASNLIKDGLLSKLWNEAEGRFNRGFNDPVKALDVNSWGSYFLIDIGKPKMALRALEFVEDNFLNTQTITGTSTPITGYGPYGTDTVWGEGSLGVALAYKKMGDTAKYQEILNEILKMQAADGGIPYSMPERWIPAAGYTFQEWKSMASTAWSIMVQLEEDDLFTQGIKQLLLYPVGDKRVQPGELLVFTLKAFNPNGRPLTYSASNLPPGATFNPDTHTFVWTPDLSQVGVYPNVHFEVTDGVDTSGEDITIVVEEPGGPYYVEWRIGQGTGLKGMKTSDIDDDGKIELVFGNDQGFIQILEYDNGQWRDEWRSDHLNSSRSVSIKALADVDNDGIVEIVATSYLHGTPYIYIFDGLTKEQEWKSSMKAYSLALADIDNDGTIEIVISSGSYIYIFDGQTKEEEWKSEGLGAASFYAPLILGDVDNDGVTEIVAGSAYYIYIFDGLTKEQEWKSDEFNSLIKILSLADIDNDGTIEIVAVSNLYIYVFDSITKEQEWKWKSDYFIYNLSLADIDNDGIIEIVAGTSSYLYVFDGLTQEQEWRSELIAGGINTLALADIDSDATIEIVAGGKYIHIFDGITKEEEWEGSSLPARWEGSDLVLTDIDSDGIVEIIVGINGHLYVLDGLTKQQELERAGGTFRFTLADIDNDGRMEIVSGTSHGYLYAYDAIAKEEEWKSDYLNQPVHSLASGDIDKDGSLEILVGTDSYLYVFDGLTKDREWETKLSNVSSIALADIDSDGTVEIVVASSDNLYAFDGITKEQEWKSEDLGGAIHGLLKLADIDNDGTIEILTANYISYWTGYLYIFDGITKEQEWKSENLGGGAEGLAVGDVDSDGVYEIAVGDYFGYIHLIDGLTKTEEWTGKLGYLHSLTFGDVDTDDSLEIVATDGWRDWNSLFVFDGLIKQEEWHTDSLGEEVGQYGSLEVADIDKDGKNEIVIGSQGYLYVIGTEGTLSLP
jgi:hypothetical protein